MPELEQVRAMRDRLVQQGEARLAQPPSIVDFTGNKAADVLLNDLSRYPHAFLMACIMDRQITAERAWLIPYELRRRLGSFDFRVLSELPPDKIKAAMKNPRPLHRFPDAMAVSLHAALQRVRASYCGDASLIWAQRPSSAAIVRRFLEFQGVGPKIATMAANILVRDFRVPVSDRYSIGISVDVHVQRLFTRLGFVEEQASAEILIYRARELNPEYPRIFDLALWELGRTICRSTEPRCSECYLSDLCPHHSAAIA